MKGNAFPPTFLFAESGGRRGVVLVKDSVSSDSVHGREKIQKTKMIMERKRISMRWTDDRQGISKS